MDKTIEIRSPDILNNKLSADLAGLWNSSTRKAHAFFLVTPQMFMHSVLQSKRFVPENMLLAYAGKKLVGMLHLDIVDEPYYMKAGVISIVMVDPQFRRRKIASEMMEAALAKLKRSNIEFIDGMGSWPYSPFYATMADGSERAGPLTTDMATINLFRKYGFRTDRESTIMRHNLDRPESVQSTITSDIKTICVPRNNKNTWLDFVFRQWRLFDHFQVDNHNRILSRAIFTRMDGLSIFSGKNCFALFGVNTPEEFRGRGLAYRNLSLLLDNLAEAGANLVELHAYSDNTPAINLYKKLGFREIAKTVSLRLSTF